MSKIDEDEFLDISGQTIRLLVDFLTDHAGSSPELETLAETLDEVQGEALQGKAVYIRVKPFSL